VEQQSSFSTHGVPLSRQPAENAVAVACACDAVKVMTTGVTYSVLPARPRMNARRVVPTAAGSASGGDGVAV
jgi:hypothetical protein